MTFPVPQNKEKLCCAQRPLGCVVVGCACSPLKFSAKKIVSESKKKQSGGSYFEDDFFFGFSGENHQNDDFRPHGGNVGGEVSDFY